MNNVWFALGLTVFAGMATGIGSAIAFLAKRTNYRFLSVATGLSAGVMLYVSFVEIFGKGVESLVESYGDPLGHWINAASFFGGMALIGIIAYGVLRFFVGGDTGVIPSEIMGILFGGVAGIIVYISLDELLPTNRAYGKGHDSLFGLVAGMLVMALSLLLMR